MLYTHCFLCNILSLTVPEISPMSGPYNQHCTFSVRTETNTFLWLESIALLKFERQSKVI